MITKQLTLPIAPIAAFDLFTRRISDWWPPERRHTGDSSSEIHLLASGRFYERARDGAEVDLGCVRRWEPPHRLVFDFYLATGPERPTEVEIVFVATANGCSVNLTHRPKPESADLWDSAAPKYQASWRLVLEAFERAILNGLGSS